MKNNLIFTLIFAAVLSACGEAGIQSDISQVFKTDRLDVTINIPALAIGQTVAATPATSVETDDIDIASEEFEDYLDELERITINKIFYSIEGFDQGNEADLDIDLNIIFPGQAPQFLLSATIEDAHLNTSNVLLFDKDAPGQVSTGAIASLENAILTGTSFKIELEIVGRNVTFQTTSDEFQFLFAFDVTARVQLN